MEDLVLNYKNKLKEILENSSEIKNYYFVLSNSNSFSYGTDKNKSGSVYFPGSLNQDIGGMLYISWKNNNLISNIDLDNNKISNLENIIEISKEQSYLDPFCPSEVKKSEYKNYESYDTNIENEIKNGSFSLFNQVKPVEKYFKNLGAKFVSAGVDYNLVNTYYVNSNGLDIKKQYTENSFSYYVDSTVGGGKSSLKALSKEEIDKRVDYNKDFFIGLSKKYNKNPKTKNIILMPGVFNALNSFYISYNLNGENIYYKKSKYSYDDFKNGVQIFNNKYNFKKDPSIDWDVESSLITSAGRSCREYKYINEGKIYQPLLSERSAKMLDIENFIPYQYGKKIIENPDGNLKDLINSLENCYVLFDILGLHTQDPLSGNFSLTCSTGLYYEKGNPLGLCKGNIFGNYFDILSNPEIKIIESGLDNKYCLFYKGLLK